MNKCAKINEKLGSFPNLTSEKSAKISFFKTEGVCAKFSKYPEIRAVHKDISGYYAHS